MSLITLTTDFGPAGRYVAQLKGVLLKHCPGATLVDLSHAIPQQDIFAAARLLRDSAPWYPEDTVHLAVVDPGVGSDRAIVAVEAFGQQFVGPDNGLFGWLTDESPAVVRVDPKQFGPIRSNTFHGRDLMAPAAARLAGGEPLGALGPPHGALIRLPDEPEPTLDGTTIEGQIIEADHYGNLITNIPEDLLDDLLRGLIEGAPHTGKLRITCGEHETFGLQTTYCDQPPQTLVALIGSGGRLELAIVQGDAAAMLGARVGDRVEVHWDSDD